MTQPRPDPQAELRVIRELLTPPAHVLREEATLEDIAAAFAVDARSQTAYLTSTGGLLTGIVPFRSLRRAIHLRNTVRFRGLAGLLQRAWHGHAASARDLARAPVGVDLHTPIRDALFQMDIRRLNDLPIIDRRGVVILELTHGAHAKLLRHLLPQGDDQIQVREDKRDQSHADMKVKEHAPLP